MNRFKDRVSQFPSRRKLVICNSDGTTTEQIADIYRYEGEITEAGTLISAEILNEFDERVGIAVAIAVDATEIAKIAEGIAADAKETTKIAEGIAVDAKETTKIAEELATEVGERVNVANKRIDETVYTLKKIQNPATGERDNLQNTINDIYYSTFWQLTAEEYDGLHLTAAGHADLGLTATEFVTNGRYLMLGEKRPTEALADKALETAEKAIYASETALGMLNTFKNPATGERDNLQNTLNAFFNFLAQGATAAEFDALNLTSQTYDNLNLTAIDFDFKSRIILGGI